MIDAANARVVNYLSIETWETVESKREYIEISRIRGDVTTGDGYYFRPEPRSIDLTLYLDVLTGTVVWDVETYEKGLTHES